MFKRTIQPQDYQPAPDGLPALRLAPQQPKAGPYKGDNAIVAQLAETNSRLARMEALMVRMVEAIERQA